MNQKRLTLNLGGPKIRASKFRKAVNAFIDLINEVSNETTNISRGVQWVVKVRPGSVLVDFIPEPDKAPPRLVAIIPETITNGLNELEKNKERPQYFSDFALEKALELASVIDPKGEDIESLQIQMDGKPSKLSHQIVANIESILKSPISAYGTIEGKLQTISVRGNIHCYIYDTLTDQGVRCNVRAEDDELFQELMDHFKKRVIAYGKIRYKKTGAPSSILLEKFKVVLDQDKLPKFNDVYGIFGEGKA